MHKLPAHPPATWGKYALCRLRRGAAAANIEVKYITSGSRVMRNKVMTRSTTTTRDKAMTEESDNMQSENQV